MRNALARFKARTPDLSTQGELAMVQNMWPGMRRPVTKAPVATRDGHFISLADSTPGASTGYRIDGGAWRLYTSPVELKAGQLLEAKAVRYGFSESNVTSIQG